MNYGTGFEVSIQKFQFRTSVFKTSGRLGEQSTEEGLRLRGSRDEKDMYSVERMAGSGMAAVLVAAGPCSGTYPAGFRTMEAGCRICLPF